jgi:hypothetical protein
MKIDLTFSFDFPPEIIRNYMFDAKATQYVVEHHPEIKELTIADKKEEAGKIHFKMKYNLDLPMPGPVKKALGGGISSLVADLIIDTTNNTGTLDITPSVFADKIKAGGRLYFEKRGDKWVQHMDGDVTVKIFAVGKMVEKYFVEKFQSSFGEESRLRNEYMLKMEKKG